MRRNTCPYLGLKDDPTTTLNFPSPGNFCHQARPIAPIKGAYQEKYCLTARHAACPLYRANHPMPLPASIAAPTAPSFTGRQLVALLGVPAMVVAFAVFTYLWNNFSLQNLLLHPVPNTGPVIADNNFGLLGAGTTKNQAPFSPSNTNLTPQVSQKDCPLPTDWVAYIVQPTDSLFRLSVIYGVSLEELQQSNCMGDQTVILPGQVIYIPFIPTSTPINEPTLAPQVLPTNPPPTEPVNTSPPPVQPTPADDRSAHRYACYANRTTHQYSLTD